MKSSTKVINRIPKGARLAAAEAFTDCVNSCVSTNDNPSWERLLSFTGRCLHTPIGQKGDSVSVHTMSLATKVKKNIATFRASPYAPGPSLGTGRPPRSSGRTKSSPLGDLVEAKIADGDTRGAIRILSSEDSFANFDDATLAALKNLHPAHEGNMTWPPPPTDAPFQATDILLKDAIKSFPPGSAGGPDLLRPQHLKDMTSHLTGTGGQRLITALSGLCNIMLKGDVPPDICPILYGASMCALNKKNGGVRPIAVGCTLRRLVAKLGCLAIRSRLGPSLQPIQLGFGTPGGAEAAAHATRRFLAYQPEHESVLLKLDFANAFNTVNRDALLLATASLLPELFQFISQCYRQPSSLFFGVHRLSSERGIQQGDPLGPALFCAVVHPLASSMTSDLNTWFLDDATLGGTPDKVLNDFKAVSQRAALLGLHLNTKKCELFVHKSSTLSESHIVASFKETAPDIRSPGQEECCVLGAPLSSAAVETALGAKTSALKLISSRLPLLRSHTAFFILKNSVAIPKLAYILRCAPTWKDTNSLQAFDAALKVALEQITNSVLPQESWTQSSLPVREGGLGIRHAVTLALPAFLASVSSTDHLVKEILPRGMLTTPDSDREEGTARWEQASNVPASSILLATSQKAWEAPLIERTKSNLVSQAPNLTNKARLLGVTSQTSGAFLNALPSTALGTLLDDNSFRIAVALRVGAQLVQPHTCVCGKSVDESGLHGLSCVKSAGRWSRHYAVNDLIRRSLVSAGYPVLLEPSNLDRSGNLRPDGTTLIPWNGGKALTWDFTCVDSLASCYLSSSAVTPRYAAREAEIAKSRKYAFLDQSHCFTPIAAECLGSFGKESEKVLRDIGKKLAVATGETRASEYFIQRISVAIQRGNAAAVMGTFPKGTSLEDYLYSL